jgi:phospholipid transport system substrate-binding protein
MRKLLIGLNLLVLSFYPIEGHAGLPLDTVKSRVNQVLDVLRDPAFKGDSSEELKKDKIRPVLDSTFDYIELSKRTLSRNWAKLKPGQREEFKKLYKRLLENVYMGRILAFKDQKVTFGNERVLAQNRAEVETKIISRSTETPIQFRMILKNGTWWVYDVVIEGISLVKNYRRQFGRILRKQSPEHMLEVLRKKVSKR